MPTYEYGCTDCGSTLERWQRFNDAPLTHCPTRGGRLHKRFSPVGVVFKGSGWYCTDSRSKSGSSEGDKGKKAEPAGATT